MITSIQKTHGGCPEEKGKSDQERCEAKMHSKRRPFNKAYLCNLVRTSSF